MAVFFVALFAVLSLSFAAMSNTNIQMSRNHRDAAEAQAAAESGLAYGDYLFSSYVTDVMPKTFYRTISDDAAATIFNTLVTYVQSNLYGSPIVEGPIISSSLDTGGETGSTFLISGIKMSDGSDTGFTLVFRRYNSDPLTIVMISTGNRFGVGRKVGLSYTLIRDTRLLDFAIASRSRIIITGDSTIDHGIYTAWDYPDFASPIELAAGSTVNGDLNTTVGEADFPLEDVDGSYENINYDQPDIVADMGIVGFEASDYNTSMYLAMTKSLLPSKSVGQVTEYFPHAPANYTLPADASSNKIIRKVYEGATYTDRYLSAGNDTLFRNCVFEGVLYVGSGGGGMATNNVRFENCTFHGPIVTSVPNSFTSETWKKNVLYFTGNCTFNNTTDMQDLAILAPNYNVNIGNTKTLTEGESVLTGLIVGGVVDIRGNVEVNGTIISMYDPDPEDGFRDATNVGYSGESSEASYLPVPDGDATGTILISPDPDRMIPTGMSSRILVLREGDSYVEY